MTDDAAQPPVLVAGASDSIRATACLVLLALSFALGTWVALERIQGTWPQTLNFTGLSIAGLFAINAVRGPHKLAAIPAGRIALAGLAAGVALSTFPPFFLMASGGNVRPDISGQPLPFLAQLAPVVVLALVWLLVPAAPPHSITVYPGAAERLESFFQSPKSRFYFSALAALAVLGLSVASGWGFRAALLPAVFAATLAWASSALLRLAGSPNGAWTLCACVLLPSALAAVSGFRAYADLCNEAALAVASTQAGRAEDERRQYDRVLKQSDALRTNGPRLDMETALARHYESKNDFPRALTHWENVARLSGLSAPFDSFAPVQRVKCSMGDSLPAWRKLVYEGFKSIADPEIAPGVMKMGESAPDVRAKLLAALLAWDHGAPEPDRRKLLEAVQSVSPGEPSSLNLLKRLGALVKDVPMSLSLELLVGRIPYQSVEKTLVEQGEASTIVCLNAGHWELVLRASGTPLHEEWPVVRVELNGTTLATTQVNKAADYDVPFTFDVTRNDIYRLKIVFQNHLEDLEEGHAARRGLRISGIRFNHAKP